MFVNLQNNCLIVVDRVKHIFKLSQGEYVAPERIEQIYSQSPLINQIFVDGSSLCSYPVALVVPNAESLSQTLNSIGHKSAALRNHSFQTCSQPKMSNNEDSKNIYFKGKHVSFAELCSYSEAEQVILDDIIQLGKTAGLNGFEQVNKPMLT